MMDDKLNDEVFLVSSDTESEFGDQKNIFYDEESNALNSVKLALRSFDRNNGDLSLFYQARFIPKLTDRSHNFLKWLIDSDLLSANVVCPNSKHDKNCSKVMEIVMSIGLDDSYQLRCKNCSRKESIRKSSIFYGLKCNLRSAIRILYGWTKGVDIELMSNILGLDRHIVGTMYNRAAKLAQSCMRLCPGLAEFGGENVVVLIDIYPNLTNNQQPLKKNCRPILCITEIAIIPQKYWLEPLDYWDKDDPSDIAKLTKQVIQIIYAVVKPGTVLVLPNYLSVIFKEFKDDLIESYTIRCLDELIKFSTSIQPLSSILETIWNVPLAICEEAQFFNPDYVAQFLTKHVWNVRNEQDSFVILISFIVYETRRNNIDSYLND